MYCHTEITIPCGWDCKNKNIIIRAFENLKIISETEKYCVVKKCGKGQKREFLIDRKDLVF